MSKKATSVKLYELKPFLQMRASSLDKSMGYLIRKILREWKEQNVSQEERKLLDGPLNSERIYKKKVADKR